LEQHDLPEQEPAAEGPLFDVSGEPAAPAETLDTAQANALFQRLLRETTAAKIAEVAPVRQAPVTPPAPARKPSVDTNVFVLTVVSKALAVLSERLAVAIGTSFLSLAVLVLNFILWWRVLPSPTFEQLGALGAFALFSLVLTLICRRPKNALETR
jgi:hypothetical protein